MTRTLFWRAFEGLGLFLALGSIIEGLIAVGELHFAAGLGWFSLWAAGLALHEWRKECRQRAEPESEDRAE